ncbi:uncharacterized protein YaiE (UPF0345 family) [Streptomyces sp. 3211.6]|uniref:hypothetical protein n=1 Tax=Streptomyces sp. 3211.6 TaxID=1938845 RepID=UPI000EAE74FF|nr:hypothetical protein [Streptomyces sp. 3211.6]RKT04874.1 uncharacterized protein YaiE (UPF0345 family) [Streptomyces sp. 3211.6]
MRLRNAPALTALLLALAAPSATADNGTGGGPHPAPAPAMPAPALPSRARASCGDGKSGAFPIGARIRGGPSVYRAGGGPQSWLLDLTNATGATCTAIHPVIVFTDPARALRPAHLRMEFEAPGGPFPVSLERSDRDEIIAVFDGKDAFPGFSVPAGGSATVKVQLAFAPDAPLGEVVADAALVQRKGDDGEWVGEAGGYRFSVEGPEEPQDAAAAEAAAGSLAHTGPREWAYGAGAVAALAAGGGLLLGARRLRRTPQSTRPLR